MSQLKLFGSSRKASHVATRVAKPAEEQVPVRSRREPQKAAAPETEKKEKVKRPLRVVAIILAILLAIEGLYFFLMYTENPFITKWRTIYINTGMGTLNHQWLVTFFIPEDIIDNVRYDYGVAMSAAIGKNSTWSKPEETEEDSSSANIKELDTEIITETDETPEEEVYDEFDFFETFWEVDQESMLSYVDAHPEVIANGWENIQINEAGLDDEGTDIQSIFGEQVLAIDVPNSVLLVRIVGSGFRGVLAVGKDPSLLSIELASTYGTAGEVCGTIAEAHDGVLSMNASGFLDPNGNGNGGQLAGYCMSNGESYGSHFTSYAYKRIELHEDNLFYIKDAMSPVSDDCTDATEFQPAMVVDGEKVVDYEWTGEQPRACIGQSQRYEILMLVIEGRRPLEGIVGTNINTCTDILLLHECMQAMNVDGGSSAMMWYDGKYVMVSSSPSARYTGGRPLPNAFVYKKAE